MRAENNELIDKFEEFFKKYYEDDIGELAQHYPNERRSLFVDWMDLYRYDHDLADDYLTNPETVNEYAEEALRLYDLAIDISLSEAHVRMTNIETTEIRELRARNVNNLISVQGIVRKATPVRPKIDEAAFECQRCGTMTYIPQSDGSFQEPHECQGCERQGPFHINFDQSEFIDHQKLRIQERPEGLRGGETPQTIDVHIEDDIPGEVSAGDRVTATGILRLEQQGSNNAKSAVFDPYMEGRSVTLEDTEFRDVDIDDEDKEEIIALAEQDDIYEQMVASMSPAIYGYEDEKLAIILQLFSGVTKHLPDDSRIRGDFHILLVGDPGTAKSQLLARTKDISPRGIYTSGKGSSAAGLTASAVKDDFADGDQWTLEAGALAMADKGVAAADELDKMDPSDRSAMHEALEQQTISVSKAGINATLKSRCSLVAAANPKYGRWDDYEPLGEQLELDPALISRFDLIFVIRDTPDREYDEMLAEHVLQSNYIGEVTTDDAVEDPDTDEVDPPIDADLLRKYVAYARANVTPKMTDAARETIKDFYVNLRAKGADEDDPVPVTARKLEGLVRLAEASARVRLSDSVDVSDAERAVRLVRSCLQEIGVDPETGQYDADVVEAGTTKTQRDRINTLEGLIDEIAAEDGNENGAPREEVIARANEVDIDPSKADHEIKKLMQKGEVYEPETDFLRTT